MAQLDPRAFDSRIDFSPITNALDGYQRGMVQSRAYEGNQKVGGALANKDYETALAMAGQYGMEPSMLMQLGDKYRQEQERQRLASELQKPDATQGMTPAHIAAIRLLSPEQQAAAIAQYRNPMTEAQLAASRTSTALHGQQLQTARATAPYEIDMKRLQAANAQREYDTPKPNTFDLGPDHTRFSQQRGPDGSVVAVPIATGGQSGGKVPPGYRMAPDGKAMEAIPGGPADIKTNEKRQQDFNSMQYMFQKLDDLGTQANILKNHPGLPGITGWRGAIPNFPGSNAANADAERTTLLSKSAFAALQDMRNASKTGGALGAIAVQELVMLQNANVALEKSQTEEQYKTNLDRLQKQIET